MASLSSSYVNVVPIGGRPRLICASTGLVAMRNLGCVWRASRIRAWVLLGAAAVVGSPPELLAGLLGEVRRDA